MTDHHVFRAELVRSAPIVPFDPADPDAATFDLAMRELTASVAYRAADLDLRSKELAIKEWELELGKREDARRERQRHHGVAALVIALVVALLGVAAASIRTQPTTVSASTDLPTGIVAVTGSDTIEGTELLLLAADPVPLGSTVVVQVDMTPPAEWRTKPTGFGVPFGDSATPGRFVKAVPVPADGDFGGSVAIDGLPLDTTMHICLASPNGPCFTEPVSYRSG